MLAVRELRPHPTIIPSLPTFPPLSLAPTRNCIVYTLRHIAAHAALRCAGFRVIVITHTHAAVFAERGTETTERERALAGGRSLQQIYGYY